jgi:hypothetical protein
MTVPDADGLFVSGSWCIPTQLSATFCNLTTTVLCVTVCNSTKADSKLKPETATGKQNKVG